MSIKFLNILNLSYFFKKASLLNNLYKYLWFIILINRIFCWIIIYYDSKRFIEKLLITAIINSVDKRNEPP
jgi:hypothetical protein